MRTDDDPFVRIALAISTLIALTVHAFVRDRWVPTAVLSYATPPPVLVALLLACAFLWRDRRRIALGMAGLCVATSLWMVAENVGFSDRDGSIRVVVWNVSRTTDLASRVIPRALLERPNIVAFVETGVTDDAGARDAFGPGWSVSHVDRRIFVAVRGRAREEEPVPLGRRGECRRFVVQVRGALFRVFVVDTSGNPFVSRKDRLAWLTRAVLASDLPTIVVGDFNTPPDSIWFDRMRSRYAESFALAGHGWGPTWPAFAPVLRIDHVWVDDFDVTRARAVSTLQSDHRYVVVDLAPLAP